MISLLNKFNSYIEKNSLVSREDRILLTVSGGVDSMVMLDLFSQSGYSVGVAHCNFQLRGVESEEDEVLVEQQATKRGVPFYNMRFDTKGEMERTGESMEMAARRLRYDWFNSLSREHNYSVIAVAHHADDSIETFFINLFRGTGLRGLTGIKHEYGKIVRPLTFATRREIAEYAATEKIPYREDSSNRSTKYLRNKIRLGLVPRMREINPQFTPLMRANLDRLSAAQQFISSCVERISHEVLSESDGIFTLHIDRIDASLQRSFVVYEILNSRFGFRGVVVDSLLRALDNTATGRRVYSSEYVAYVDRGNILIAHISQDDICEVMVAEDTNRAYCGNSSLDFERLDIDLIEHFDLGCNVALIDMDKLQFPLTLRRWREGDSFVPLGMTGHKKVSDFLIDEKVSQPEKDRQFVLTSGDDIVWLLGRRIDERFKVGGESENILKITKEII